MSGGSAHTVPTLLLPDELLGWRLSYLSAMEQPQQVDLDGTPCLRIDGIEREAPVSLWVEEASLLVRRLEEQHRFDDFWTETTTTYTLQMDAPVPDDALASNLPGGWAGQRRALRMDAARAVPCSTSPRSLQES